MANHGLIVGLDVGTNTIKALAADVRNQQVNIVAVGRAVSHGVKRGVVVDIDATAADIRQAMAQVNEQAGQTITDVIAALPAENIQIPQVNGQVTVEDSQHISYKDVEAAVRESVKGQTAVDREIVDLVPTDFAVDDFDGIQDPNDMVGMRLTMNGIAYTAPKNVLGNLKMAISKAGLNLRDCVLTPLATSKTVLSEAEQEFGSILLDLGAGQTTASVVQNNQIKFIASFPAGGENISKDISTVLSIGGYDAEMLKLDSGVAMTQLADSQEQLMVTKVGQAEPEAISQAYLSQIIEARVDQILGKLAEKLGMVSALQMPGGVTALGGGAALEGMTDAIQNQFGTQARLFVPDDIGLRHPGFANTWAVIQYAALQLPVQLIVKQALYGMPLTTNREGHPATVSQPVNRTAQSTPKEQEATLVAPDDPSFNQDDANQADTRDSKKKPSKISGFFREFFD
ncbi:cell division protein FtsA [Weissella uvarum]|uniref:cell division protein FtsA n=1 Tax=Weissella uvarum TaxID=1479233 RepID=UPI00195F9736|nr:cell division protein FtsA [Weissella uvarum]MBM7617789.1 cell division protein FtsA [Weissella uvarum]MCM0595832.1 cell division protein FtsA [Weissella uvarum]